LLKKGKYIKDLSYMNRDLKDVVYVDFDDEKAEFHRDNVLVLPRWEGDPTDRELYDIMPFLESKRIFFINNSYRSRSGTWLRRKTGAETLRQGRHGQEIHGALKRQERTHSKTKSKLITTPNVCFPSKHHSFDLISLFKHDN
jgi:hypothetical protein